MQWATHLAGEWLLRVLSIRSSVKINNDIHASITRPTTYLLEICKSTIREVLAVILQAFVNPVSDRNTDSVETVADHLVDIILSDPSRPVCRPNRISLALTQSAHAIKFGTGVVAAHIVVPLVACHPWLNNELGPEIDASNLPRCR